MTALSHTISDSTTMLRRNLRHALRYPSLTLIVAGMPIVFLLLFVYVLGGTLGAGLGGPSGGRAEYVEYLAPGLLVLAVAAAAQGTAISVAMDMTQGIIARFRTMSIARAAVLAGHVGGAVVQTMVGLALVLGAALLVGFRPDAGPGEWPAAIGLLALVSLALSWLSTAMGLATKTVEAASNAPMPLILLPFLSSAFVPTDTMPTGLAWFAEHQPFTPIIEALRACLEGRDPGADAWWAVGWCVAIIAVCSWWAGRLFQKVRAV